MGDAPPRVVVVSERLGPIGVDERGLEALGAQVRSAPLWSTDTLVTNAKDADILLVGAVEPVDATALEALSGCVAVVRRGVGHDNVDVAAATRLGIVVANVPDASVEEVSDHALALLLTLERRIVRLDAAVHAGVWQRDPRGIAAARTGIRRIAELTLGVVGFGRIGRAFARKAAPSYRRVLVADPMVPAAAIEAAGAVPVDLDRLFAEADHVSLHAPLGDGTRHLVDAQVLAGMRPGAVIVNTSRGGLIDEHALVEAVRAGRLGGAGLDVTEREPVPDDHPVLSTDGILVTAHSAAFSATSSAELRERAVAAAADVLSGRLPASVVNPEVLASPALRATQLRRADV
jgi:D-3-phosphoglycerate dehydrogenase